MFSAQGLHQPPQRSGRLPDLLFELDVLLFAQIAQALGGMKAVTNLGERRGRDLQKMHPVRMGMPSISFNDIHRHGERGTTKLRGLTSEPGPTS